MPKLFTAVAATAALFTGLSSAQTYGGNTTISNVTSSACPTGNGVHVIVARASLEAPGYGIIGYVKDRVLERIPGSNAEFVDYPATLNDYINSETAGVEAMRGLITSFAARCPCSLLVTMGYSQGAQVTADSLVGQVDMAFPANGSVDSALPTSILARTAAVIIMGDPSALYNQSFIVGTTDKNGVFPRHDTPNFNIAGLGSRTQSYCDKGDPYCAAEGNLTVHLGYVQEYGAQAVNFTVNQVNKLQSQSNYTTCHASGNSTSTNGTATNGTGSARPTGTGGVGVPTGAPSGSPSPAPYRGSAAVTGAPYVLGAALLAGVFALAL